MSRKISQDAFNQLVKEIVTELEVTPEEAVEDAVLQLQAQGVDLTNIRKSIALNFIPPQEIRPLEIAVNSLDELLHEGADKDAIIDDVKFLCEACGKSTGHKVFMGKTDFVRLAFDILHRFPDDVEFCAMVLKALIHITTDQPDILGSNVGYNMSLFLERELDENCLNLLLTWMKVACIKHEENRQSIVESNCIPLLKNVLESSLEVPSIIKGVFSTFRALTLDDDIRVEFGQAHENARKIAEATLATMIKLLKKYKSEKEVVGEVILTLSAVIVRNEYCEKLLDIREGESLSYILDVFVNFPDSEKLNRQCMRLLKVLAGSDKVKGEIIKAGAASIIVMAMTRLRQSAQLIAAGNGCIAALTLRSSSNSQAFCDADAPEVILDGMRTHKQDLSVQKQGCWAIRNMVSRNRDICPVFLELGAEELINYILQTYSDQCEYDAKAALRDLGCKVDLREEWTGEGGALN
ncbi:Armadillo repeat-containing protein 6-like protein [Gryllus bimaculatus]|nr:Armadillo repeat-containing protein 6-like protein [Gryllus bimaculatus]